MLARSTPLDKHSNYILCIHTNIYILGFFIHLCNFSCLSLYLYVYLHNNLQSFEEIYHPFIHIRVSIQPSIYLSIYLSLNPPIKLIHLYIYLNIYCIYLSICTTISSSNDLRLLYAVCSI